MWESHPTHKIRISVIQEINYYELAKVKCLFIINLSKKIVIL